MPHRLPQIAWAFVAGIVIFTALIPRPFLAVLRNVAAVWNAALLAAAALTLLWFVYWVFLRKMFRARRIANLRFKRLMDEIAKRPSGSGR